MNKRLVDEQFVLRFQPCFSFGIVSKDTVLKYKKDRERFIAHAGGEIDGKKYTNSLEALNESYKKGFKLFELDIIETKDGHFVAAHDWKHWAAITGYTGSLPPTRDEFTKYRIHRKYTPLTIDDINSWFKIHNDAILVTDKIDKPKAFVQVFNYKNRLFMELFSKKSLIEAINIGILAVAPTWGLIKRDINNEKDIQNLLEMGVTTVMASRRELLLDIDKFTKMKKLGIRVYVFHVNFDKGIDEKYVVKNDFSLVYGMYADSWKFN